MRKQKSKRHGALDDRHQCVFLGGDLEFLSLYTYISIYEYIFCKLGAREQSGRGGELYNLWVRSEDSNIVLRISAFYGGGKLILTVSDNTHTHYVIIFI